MKMLYVLVFIFASSQAFASSFGSSFYFNSLLSPEVQSVNAGGSGSSAVPPQNGLKLDSRTVISFLVSEKVFLGAAVNFQSDHLKSEMLGQTVQESSSTIFESGPAIGFTSDGFHASFAYFLYGTDKSKLLAGTSTDQETKYSGLSGWQMSAGYNFQLSPAFSVGPALVYRTVSYKKHTFTDNRLPSSSFTDRDLTTEKNDSRIKPMISVMLKF